jgi:hypothetical protein
MKRREFITLLGGARDMAARGQGSELCIAALFNFQTELLD